MAIKTINDEHLYAIGNAIREKNGTEETYKPSEMAAAILDITGGGNIVYTGVFENRGAMRTAEKAAMNHFKPAPAFNYNGNIYYKMFNNCYTLNKIENIPVIQDYCDENRFIDTFRNCYMASELTFETNNGNPYPVYWSGQYIETAAYKWVGMSCYFDFALGTCGKDKYTNDEDAILNSGAGITTAYRVSEDDTYQTYYQKKTQGGSNWYSTHLCYSKYNRYSVVRTFESLPDASAYLAATGKPANTIFIMGGTGNWTGDTHDPYYHLTDEEIAVATEKGWTVSISPT